MGLKKNPPTLSPMEINFLVRVSARTVFFLPRQNISSFVTDCFLPTTKYPKVTRLTFNRAQVLKWVLINNCNCYLVFFLHFCTILIIRRCARSLKLWNEIPSNTFQSSLPKNKCRKTKADQNPAPNFDFWLTRTRNSTSSGLIDKSRLMPVF